MRTTRVLVALAALAVAMAGMSWILMARTPIVDAALSRPTGSTVVRPPDGVAPTVIAAGDIAACNGGASDTAGLIQGMDGVVAPLGDLAYEDGTLTEYADCYVPTWGQFVDRTRPAQGNHDVRTRGAAGYFDVLGESAGPAPQGYYTYQLEDWLVVVINSNCDQVGGCDSDSPQVEWLRDTLAAATTENILAYWHHPRWSTGRHGDNSSMDAVWRELANAGADLVLAGHDHDYQRYEPLDADGQPAVDGMRQFVVGTGGKGLRARDRTDDRLAASADDRLGVLKLELDACGYSWKFVTTEATTLDRGRATGTC